MLKILRVILSVIVMALAGSVLITKNFEIMPYMMFYIDVLMLVTEVAELQAKGKTGAIFSILVAEFLFLSPLLFFMLTRQDT